MKRRIHRIGNSKEPTLEILRKITENLYTKFNKSSNVSIDSWEYSIGDKKIKFQIYINKTHNEYYETWPKLLSAYHTLMKEAN